MHPRIAGLVIAVAAPLAACSINTQPEPPGPSVVEVTAAPPEIQAAPSVVYEGRPTYYYRDRWYYHNGRTWAYYQREPPALHRQRHYVQQAPAAPRGYPGPASAPPAVRVR